jgi:hypothetical protein
MDILKGGIMERKRFVAIILGITMVFSAFILTANLGISNAGECRIVSIYGQPDGQVTFRLDPDTVTVKKDTCVIWLNWARTEQVQVVFEEGKVCEDVTESPVGFKLDAVNCYVTDDIPLGATSSLLFVEEGEYKYILKSGTKKVNGKIIVKDSAPK